MIVSLFRLSVHIQLQEPEEYFKMLSMILLVIILMEHNWYIIIRSRTLIKKKKDCDAVVDDKCG